MDDYYAAKVAAVLLKYRLIHVHYFMKNMYLYRKALHVFYLCVASINDLI